LRIAVLSDTHVHSLGEIPQKIIESLSTVDLIIHAGDFTTTEVLNGLKQLGKVTAVQGNMDSAEVKNILPVKVVIKLANKRIGITHGWGSPWRIEHRVRKMFEQVDIVIYGHSHQSQNKVIDNILFFNPGKATKSFGVLTIEEDVTGEIISST
jgi:uncharacterized protein